MNKNNYTFLNTVFFIFLTFAIGYTSNLDAQNNNNLDIIKIGLLIPSDHFTEAKHGAELQIEKINAKGGIDGHQVQLIIKSLEGPWGTGSKQAVDLIFNDNVWAIIGAIKGRNAHLVEQACAKTNTVFLSTWASDPTLSQAYVPWYFNCVPNDNQQTKALLKELSSKQKITIITENDYDSKMTLKCFLENANNSLIFNQFSFDTKTQNLTSLIQQIKASNSNALVLFSQPSSVTKIIQQLVSENMNQPIYTSLAVLGENENKTATFNFENQSNVYSVNYKGLEWNSFKQDYQSKFNKKPGAIATYTYDALSLVVQALKNSTLDRETIQKEIVNIKYSGASGTLQFNSNGNRINEVKFVEIKK